MQSLFRIAISSSSSFGDRLFEGTSAIGPRAAFASGLGVGWRVLDGRSFKKRAKGKGTENGQSWRRRWVVGRPVSAAMKRTVLHPFQSWFSLISVMEIRTIKGEIAEIESRGTIAWWLERKPQAW